MQKASMFFEKTNFFTYVYALRQPMYFSYKKVISKKKTRNSVSGLFGPSYWIRTSGLLNPIQARYQTSPNPDISCAPEDLHIITHLPEMSRGILKNFQVFLQKEKDPKTRSFRIFFRCGYLFQRYTLTS